MKRIFKFILELIIVIFVFLAVVEIAFVLMKDENGVTHFGNYIPIPIRDDSMEPTINMDDLIVDKEVSTPTKIKENDVITYLAINGDTKEIKTGRVISIVNSNGSIAWKVRGDNGGESSTTTVLSSDLIGQFTNTKMLFAGGVLAFVESQNGFLVCIIIPLVLIFFIQICKLIHTLITDKKEKKEKKELDDEVKEENKSSKQDKIQEPINNESQEKKDLENKTNVVEDNEDELASPIVVLEPVHKKEEPQVENKIEDEFVPETPPEINISNQNNEEITPPIAPPIIEEVKEPNFTKPTVGSIEVNNEELKTNDIKKDQEIIEQNTDNNDTVSNSQPTSDDIEIL